ncbi:SDR family NAD(P)-dependent oxidoreductase [Microlunatus soli]|uniref:NAD(P)-dependent dehydrogenase, short-chain alcohol dehydrogenase family n=1 Tax=Microlunatus soli TaxID=630515 RepID=A0A1H1RUP4_9ACTN|nr:SDR family oxidoreductase [Microlunatus soli]SDS39236.1 NAD(P)-dependent dehydrogenase, short-chain alcohol dehydrogenase family [Microlunatus soli]
MTAADNEEQRASGRRILISGGSSGIGLAAAERLAATDRVWILGSSTSSVEAAVRHSAAPFTGSSACDLADHDQIDAAVDEVAARLGGLDAVFVNAGIDGQGVPAQDLSLDHFRRVLEINVLGAFALARAGLRHLDRPGTILFTASVNAVKPEVDFLDYNASKAAVVSIAKTLALEVSHQGVCVIALCPGYFPTPMTNAYLDDPAISEELLSRIPARRFGTLDEIAETVDFLLSPAARFMTGAVLTLDGGTNL